MSQKFIQGATNHLNWVMVDSTDFATPESALSAATKIKIYGQLNTAAGTNFVSSGTGSLTNDITHVGASATGQYHIALAVADLSDASAAFYDHYVITLSATGAAYQTIIADGERTDTSYISALLSDIYSAVTIGNSRVLLAQSYASDAHSAAILAASTASEAQSNALLILSRLSDLDSRLASDVSDILSSTRGLSDFQSKMSDTVSDILSTLGSQFAVLSNYQSNASNYLSYISGIVSGLGAGQSTSAIADKVWSDFGSKAGATPSQLYSVLLLAASRVSDVQSYLVDMSGMLSDTHSAAVVAQSIGASDLSDLRSAIGAGPAATITASDISDIASAVNVILASNLSDILSAAVQTNSRVVLIQSRLSDLDSRLASEFSDIMSNIDAVTAAVSASDISDIASAVADTLASRLSDILSAAVQTNSRVLVVQSLASDAYSAAVVAQSIGASDMSDLRSAIAGVTAVVSASDISDIASAVRAALVSDLSDILSAAAQTNSRALVIQSMVSDVDSALSSQFAVNTSTLSDIHSAAILAASNASEAQSNILLVQSRLSDFQSAYTSDISDVRSMLTALSDAISNVDSAINSQYSDLLSTMGSQYSDLKSAVGAVSVTIGASDISDLASQVVSAITSAVMDVNVVAVAGVSVTGTGVVGDTWGPA